MRRQMQVKKKVIISQSAQFKGSRARDSVTELYFTLPFC